MNPLTAWNFIKAHGLEVAVAALLVVALLLVAFCTHPRRDPVDKATIAQQQKVGDANTNASAARVDDAVKAEQQKEELNHAIENVSDADVARVRRGCVIMRQQGRDTAGIPACR